ncbi:MAG: hypothetical protein AAFO91_02180 [Bacteroidota bacterium]
MMTKREKAFREAAHKYIKRMEGDPDVIGIILSGSLVHAEIAPNSDVDIYVITDPYCLERERGNTWIDGVEIEYFMNPPQQIRAYFVKEKSPHTAHILANGEVVFSRSDEVQKLIEEAKAVLAEAPPAPSAVQIELFKYHFDDLCKDYADCLLREDAFATTWLKSEIARHAMLVFCQVHRIHHDKVKRLEGQLRLIDPAFADMLKDFVLSDWQAEGPLKVLRQKMSLLLGGERKREWVLRSDLDL